MTHLQRQDHPPCPISTRLLEPFRLGTPLLSHCSLLFWRKYKHHEAWGLPIEWLQFLYDGVPFLPSSTRRHCLLRVGSCHHRHRDQQRLVATLFVCTESESVVEQKQTHYDPLNRSLGAYCDNELMSELAVVHSRDLINHVNCRIRMSYYYLPRTELRHHSINSITAKALRRLGSVIWKDHKKTTNRERETIDECQTHPNTVPILCLLSNSNWSLRTVIVLKCGGTVPCPFYRVTEETERGPEDLPGFRFTANRWVMRIAVITNECASVVDDQWHLVRDR